MCLIDGPKRVAEPKIHSKYRSELKSPHNQYLPAKRTLDA